MLFLAKAIKVVSFQPLNVEQLQFVEMLILFMFLSGLLVVLSAVFSRKKEGKLDG